MSTLRTERDGVKQLILTTPSRSSLFYFSPEEWEAVKKFFGIDLLLRLNKLINEGPTAPPFRWPDYQELKDFAERWEKEPETIGERTN